MLRHMLKSCLFLICKSFIYLTTLDSLIGLLLFRKLTHRRVYRLKCDLEKPCQNCVVRGDATAAACTYAEKIEKETGPINPRDDAEDMRKRLNRLENSILSIISSDAEHRGN